MSKRKPRDDEDDDDSEASDGRVLKLDEATLAFLGRVRKGKHCRFLMSTKGSRIGALVLKKSNKRITPKEVAESREGGYQAIWGVVSGKGMQIHFQISTADGFPSLPSIKPAKLKQFLNDRTDEKNWRWQPTLELVAEPPALPFEEESLGHPFVKKFLAMEGQLPKLLERRPELARLARKRFDEVRRLLSDEESLASAGSQLRRLERTFAEWRDGEPDEQSRSLAEVQRELAPKLGAIWKKQGLKYLPRLAKLRLVLQEKSKEKRLDQALRMLDTLQTHLAGEAPLDPDRALELRKFLARNPSFQTLDKYLKIKAPLVALLDGFDEAFRRAMR